MRIIAVVILILFKSYLGSSQSALDQEINLNVENYSLEEVLVLLNENYNLNISFSKNVLPVATNITAKYFDTSISNILNNILNNTSLAYSIEEGSILIYKLRTKQFHLSGIVKDSISGEKLIAAHIFCSNSGIGSFSNEQGHFNLLLNDKNAILHLSYIGYKSKIMRLNIEESSTIEILLSNDNELNEIVIIPTTDTNRSNDSPYKTHRISQDFLQVSAGLGGTPDVLRASAFSAGIQAANDGLSGIQVRGSSADQNLLLLDGTPIYLPYHLLGMYSVYNPNLIKSAKLVKNHFPARYGGRISSIYDIRIKEGNENTYSAEAGFDMNSFNFLAEGPLPNNKGTLLLGGRIAPRNYLFESTYKKTFFPDNSPGIKSKFNDFNFKINYKLNSDNNIIVSLFNGTDKFHSIENEENEDEENEQEVEFDWKNLLASVQWNNKINKRFFLSSTARFSSFGYQYNSLSLFASTKLNDFYYLNTQSDNQDIGVNSKLQITVGQKNLVQLGVDYSYKIFEPGVTAFEEEDEDVSMLNNPAISDLTSLSQANKFKSHSLIFFIEDHFSINNLNIDLGLRQSIFKNESKTYFNFEPRFLLNYTFYKNLNIYYSYSKISQQLHLINSTALRLPNDLWIPSTKNLAPESATHHNLGISIPLFDKVSLTIEAYHKRLINLLKYEEGFEFNSNINNTNPAEYLTSGTGTSKGIESTLYYKTNQFGFTTSYTYAKSERKFDDVNLSNSYPFEFDRRHQFKIFSFLQLSKNTILSGNYTLYSPQPILGISDINNNQGLQEFELNEVGSKNELRGNSYQRLDINISTTIRSKHFLYSISAGAYNVTGHKNLTFLKRTRDTNGIETDSNIYGLPFIPALSFKINY